MYIPHIYLIMHEFNALCSIKPYMKPFYDLSNAQECKSG